MILPVLKWENKIQRKPKNFWGPEGTSPAGRAEPRVKELGSEWGSLGFRFLCSLLSALTFLGGKHGHSETFGLC